MTISSSLMLYHTSDKVHALNGQMHKLNAHIEGERKSIHVLKAEWVYLANPARIETQAKRHLGMELTTPGRIAALENMSDLLPNADGDEPPVRLAAQTATPATPPAVAPKREAVVRTKLDRVLASINTGRINDHMVMGQSAAKTDASGVAHALAGAKTDRIGALIGSLGLNR
jgi:cell division protein FtsL